MNPVIEGSFFNGETLAARPVTLTVTAGRIHDVGPGCLVDFPLADLRISDRLGDIPRFLYFPGGRTVVTTDNQAVDALLSHRRQGRLVAVIHALERQHRVAATATLLLVVSVVFVLWWGLPVLARQTALAIPASLEAQAGRVSLAAIERILGPTALDRAERERIETQAARLAKVAGLAEPPKLVFRSMGALFPNAFALPGGFIVMSDELVRLAENDQEVAAVIAHEIGHWQHRHGMQVVLRSSTALLLVSTVTGDLSTLTTFAGTIPFQLLQRGYSREFETEADAYAVDLMEKASIGPAHFISILKKLEEARPKQGNDFTYLSTHPNTAERIKRIKASSSPLLPLNQAEVQPRALNRVAPNYPSAMRLARIKGRVTVEFVIDADGNVRDALVVQSSHKEFEEPALAAVRQWTFIPGRREGRNIAIQASQLLEFDFEDDSSPPPAPVAPPSPD